MTKKKKTNPNEVHSPQCVVAIVRMLSDYDWATAEMKEPKNWKRIEKHSHGVKTVRLFENKPAAMRFTVVVIGNERIQGMAWEEIDSKSTLDKQLEAVSKVTGASMDEVKNMAEELKNDYEPCSVCGYMLKKGVMDSCEKCKKIACKRCLPVDGVEVTAELVDVYGVPAGSKLHWCADCLGNTEKQHVESVTFDELPLLMGRKWLTTSTEGLILNRIGKGE